MWRTRLSLAISALVVIAGMGSPAWSQIDTAAPAVPQPPSGQVPPQVARMMAGAGMPGFAENVLEFLSRINAEMGLLSENDVSAELLSNNEMEAQFMSGNELEAEFMSGNEVEAEVFSGNEASLFSNIQLNINVNIQNSGNEGAGGAASFEALDANRDMRLSYQEFRGADPPVRGRKPRRRFRRLDEDGDQHLSRNEFVSLQTRE